MCRRKALLKVRITAFLAWMVGILYIIANLSFVMIFLAKVSRKDHRDYVEPFAMKDSVAALFTFVVCMWMWALRTRGDVHTFVTKELTVDLNEASNAPSDDIAAQMLSARSVLGENDADARTNQPLAVVVAGTADGLRTSCGQVAPLAACSTFLQTWLILMFDPYV